jgi:cob(I)alamin adenosyltransferase
MGHRLSKIVTRTGDGGTTGLGDGSRVAKDSARIDAIGAVDELNSTSAASCRSRVMRRSAKRRSCGSRKLSRASTPTSRR